MTGETDLSRLLQNMKPERNPGEYGFCTVDSLEGAIPLRPVCIFQEKEAVTVILPREQADRLSLSYSMVCAWITLTVHSALEAVGLTAAVSQALAKRDISCNVVAAYYHDHVFVPVEEAKRAMEALITITKEFPS